jgi:hypothetical protein
VHEKENAERDDPGQLMKLSQQKCAAQFYGHLVREKRLFRFLQILEPNE